MDELVNDQAAVAMQLDAATCVYVGPMITDPYVVPMTIFRGGLPEPLRTAAESDPDLRRLVVPIGSLAAARRQVQKPGHPLHEAAAAVAARYRRAGGGA